MLGKARSMPLAITKDIQGAYMESCVRGGKKLYNRSETVLLVMHVACLKQAIFINDGIVGVVTLQDFLENRIDELQESLTKQVDTVMECVLTSSPPICLSLGMDFPSSETVNALSESVQVNTVDYNLMNRLGVLNSELIEN